jgi:hypothetical protein
MGTFNRFPSDGTELFICSKDIPNVAHHFWNVIKWYIVLFVVSLSRQLRYPRHIFWAAVSLFEMIFLVQSNLEMVVILHRDYLACPPYVILASVDYSIKHPVDQLPLDGCAGSLLGHRPLRVVQEEGHQSRLC